MIVLKHEHNNMNMRIMQCALCGKKEDVVLLYKENINPAKVNKKTYSARRIPEKVHFRLLQCKNCGLIVSSPIFPEEKIRFFYRQSTVTYQKEIPALVQTYGYYLGKTLKYLPRNPKLLEIGCGNGFFLEKARQLGIMDVWGIEPAREAAAQASKGIKKRIIVDFFPTASIKPESFDIICIFQTLDHILDPNIFLKACYKILKKGGIVLCIVHDSNGLSVKLLGENSPIFDIEHIYLFNKKNLAKTFEKNGFMFL